MMFSRLLAIIQRSITLWCLAVLRLDIYRFRDHIAPLLNFVLYRV